MMRARPSLPGDGCPWIRLGAQESEPVRGRARGDAEARRVPEPGFGAEGAVPGNPEGVGASGTANRGRVAAPSHFTMVFEGRVPNR